MFDIGSKLQRMNRRRFLNTLTGLGVSGTALSYLTKDEIADIDFDEEVPRLGRVRHINHRAVTNGEEPEREAIYYTIRREKWAVVETAHDAASQVNDMLEAAGLDSRVSAGVTTLTRNQRSQKAVVVKRTVTERADGETITPDATKDQLKEMLPDTVAGTAGEGQYQRTIDQIPVKIETERMSLSDTGPGSHYDHVYRPVPAGSNLVKSNNRYGSGCATAHNDDADKYDLISAGHIVKTEKMYQNEVESGDKIGTRRDEKTDDPGTPAPAFDAGVVDLEPDYSYRFASDSGNDEYWDDHHIFGIVGRDKLKDNENDSLTIYRRGARTGMERGNLGDVHDDDHAFDTAADENDGDSGGPHFTRVYDSEHGIWEVYIAGVHYAGDTTYSRATMIDEVESRYDLTI